MPLSTVRDLVIKATGRKDWESVTSDLDDLINRAQRWLDGLQETVHTRRRYITRVYPGDTVIPIPGIRVIREVWLYGNDGRSKLVKEERDNLLGLYTTFLPPLIGDDIITNGRFDGASTSWTLGSGWTYTLDTIEHAAGLTNTLSQTITALDKGTFRLVFVLSNVTAGSVTPALSGTNGTAIAVSGVHVQEITVTSTPTTITFTPTSDFEGRIDSVELKRIIDTGNTGDAGTPLYWAPNITVLAPGQLSFDVSDLEQRDMAQDIIFTVFSKRGILIYPPSDTTFDINIIGDFFSPTLVASTDVSYWTEEYPEALSLAVQYLYEIRFRNDSGAKAIRRQLDDLLSPIDSGLVSESIVDVYQMEG